MNLSVGKYELLIGTSQTSGFLPAVQEGVKLTLKRRSTPGKLDFSMLKETAPEFEEGDPVHLKINGVPVFMGYVFTKQSSKDSLLKVTAYDQIRYLKNKSTYVYKNKTASDFIKMVCEDFHLTIGDLADTGYKIPSRVEDNTSLFKMIENALDLTMQNTKQMFVLYDDFGKLTLKNIADMKVPDFLVYDGNSEDFTYTSSIDKQTYNKVVLMYNDSEKGERTPCVASDESNMNKWGVLQYFDDSLTANENGNAKAEALLKLYNRKTKNLKLKGIFGNPNIRPGCLIPTLLDLGDVQLKNYMMVEDVTHNLYLDEHSMDLTLVGHGFTA